MPGGPSSATARRDAAQRPQWIIAQSVIASKRERRNRNSSQGRWGGPLASKERN